MKLTAAQFLELEQVDEIGGHAVRQDRFGDQFVFIPYSAQLEPEEWVMLKDRAIDERHYKSVGQLKQGVLYAIGG